jgi:DNA-binding transcriptional ArsR family regulator
MTQITATVGSQPVGSLQTVLGALQDPVRLKMVRRLANAGTAVRCNDLYETISKSTATHHFKTLREAGLTEKSVADGQTYQRLRATEVEAAFPGLLPPIIKAANHAREG